LNNPLIGGVISTECLDAESVDPNSDQAQHLLEAVDLLIRGIDGEAPLVDFNPTRNVQLL